MIFQFATLFIWVPQWCFSFGNIHVLWNDWAQCKTKLLLSHDHFVNTIINMVKTYVWFPHVICKSVFFKQISMMYGKKKEDSVKVTAHNIMLGYTLQKAKHLNLIIYLHFCECFYFENYPLFWLFQPTKSSMFPEEYISQKIKS